MSRRSVLKWKRGYWSPAEEAIIKEFYPLEGRKKCLARLPGRTLRGLIHHARLLGAKVSKETASALRAAAAPGNRSTKWSEAEDAILRRLYPSGGTAACVPKLPKRTRDAITLRAGRLGISTEGANKSNLMSGGRLAVTPTVSEADALDTLDALTKSWMAQRAVPRMNSISGTIYDREEVI